MTLFKAVGSNEAATETKAAIGLLAPIFVNQANKALALTYYPVGMAYNFGITMSKASKTYQCSTILF